jgi:hypothetical protein
MPDRDGMEPAHPRQSYHIKFTQIPPASLSPNAASPTIEHAANADDGIMAQANKPTSQQANKPTSQQAATKPPPPPPTARFALHSVFAAFRPRRKS